MTSFAKFELLIVEDDAHLRELLRAAAQRTGRFSRIRTAGDGREALTCIQADATQEALPDFILSDLSMPYVDGIQLIQELKRREATRHIPVAVMTSSNRPNDREDAIAAGCCAFFNKPMRLEEMATLIGSIPGICGTNAPVSSPVAD